MRLPGILALVGASGLLLAAFTYHPHDPATPTVQVRPYCSQVEPGAASLKVVMAHFPDHGDINRVRVGWDSVTGEAGATGSTSFPGDGGVHYLESVTPGATTVTVQWDGAATVAVTVQVGTCA